MNAIHEIEVLDDGPEYSLQDICLRCQVRVEVIVEYVEYGIVEAHGDSQNGWLFSPSSLSRLQRAFRLQRDLEVNLPGLALALDLLDEMDEMRAEIQRLHRRHS